MREHLIAAPLPTIRRIPRYLNVLENFAAEQISFVSATDIANKLGLKPIQVRKDMAFTGIVGKPKVGYKTDELIETIKSFLGWDSATDAFLIGAGALGTALLGYRGFAERGLQIVAAFDTDPEKVGKRIHGKEVFPISKMAELAKRMQVHIGILTVPAESASQCAHALMDAGITGIWNFSPAELDVPESMTVQREDLSAGLAVLSVRMSEKKQGIV
ncbi:redox-sensing transcriptional repressor Rex [Sediminispirochaeta bajacaliforniensis]|uniref:redox-sensing transcriptional repressor Rex n=1 Tax=Sediminispirochaeta bajacaliforniensis TaxID=148 RepID=UPI00036539B4|nr:redox-sensing transcriptional repressor Rex [Sediminispirochaeta bajacaliforniensis]